jgi:MYXO-CTERM domain-containing protein
MRGKVFTRLGGLLGAAGLAACAVGGAPEGEEGDPTTRFWLQREASTRGALASHGANAGLEAAGGWVHRYVVLEGPAAVEAARAPGDDAAQRTARVKARIREIDAHQEALLPQIEATGARVVYRYRRLANAIQVTAPAAALEALGRLPGVTRLDTVTIHERRLKSAVPFVGGYKAWSAQGATIHGEGVRIGIVDTGIDYLHAAFGGPGTPEAYKQNDPAVIEPGTFPTAKVLGGIDFVGDTYDASQPGSVPIPDDDPLDCQGLQGMNITGGHGTHVAGTAAGLGVLASGETFYGPYDQSLNPNQFRVGPGVAPMASLYALKVFGCSGSTAVTNAAFEWAADPNEDGDLSDHLDVLNLSLGGSYGLSSLTEVGTIKNITDLGTFLAIAAGNEGNTFYVTGWPSTATEALAVAATTDAISFQALTVLSPPGIAGDVACLEGAFTKPLALSGVIEGDLVAAEPALACQPLSNPQAIQGKIAFIDRGTCTFVKKIQHAFDAGAIAVVVADREDSDVPFAMGGDGTEVDIPGVLIRKVNGDAIRDQLAQGVKVRMDPQKQFVTSLSADQMAGFSSRGPRSVDNALKPEIGAPGVAIDAAGVGTGTGPRQLQGTSMACPVIAGAAALVKQANPSFSTAEVKAALMNTAVPGQGPKGEAVPVSLMGAGRVQVDLALSPPFTAAASEPPGAVGVSFGAIIVSKPTTEQRAVEVTNHGDSEITLQAAAQLTYETPGVTLAVDPPSVTVPAKGKATVQLSLTVDPALLPAPAPDPLTPEKAPYVNQPRHFLTEAGGHLTFTGDGASARVPFHAIARAADEIKAAPGASLCGASLDKPILLPLDGPSTSKVPVTTAFELGAESPPKGAAGSPTKMGDLLAVGVANNLPVAESFENASVYFGIVVYGQWTTPAMGPQSVVGVYIDTNDDKKADYAVLIEPLRRQPPYFDVLTASPYNLKNGQQGQPRFLNIFPRDQVESHPFNNSVAVLPVTLSAIGLKKSNPRFNYQAFSDLNFPQLQSDQTKWVTYDLDALAIDTAKGGREGRPVYDGKKAVEVHLGPAAQPGQLPKVLLLHHSNVAGQRHEILDLNALTSGEQADLEVSLAANIPGGGVATATVKNKGPAAAKNVKLTLDPGAGASISGATPSAGTCATGAKGSCELGELAADQQATVELKIQGPGKLTVSAAASTDVCDPVAANNQAQFTTEGTGGSGGGAGAAGAAGFAGAAGSSPGGAASPALGPFSVGGGCDCGVAAGSSRAGGAALAALGLAALLRRRRRDG